MKALLTSLLLIALLLIGGVIGFGGEGECSWPNCGGGGGATPGVPCARMYVENPGVTELFETVTHFDQDVTITRIICQCSGAGTSIDFAWLDDDDDIEVATECTISTGLDITDIDSPDIAAGSDIDLSITDRDGPVLVCTFLMYCE